MFAFAYSIYPTFKKERKNDFQAVKAAKININGCKNLSTIVRFSEIKGGFMKTIISISTVNLISKLLQPLAEAGMLSMVEKREIISQLKNLAKEGKPIPAVIPKLITQVEASEMLGLGLANFKKIERNGGFPFKRKQIGKAVRYRNIDIVNFILSEDDIENRKGNGQKIILK
jgi:hypothetical protein